MNSQLYRKILSTTFPVALGYIPFGMAWGILFSHLGYHWIYSGLFGFCIYAGTAQFMAIGLLAAHSGLLEVFVSTLIINSRHIFYGISFIRKYKVSSLHKLYLAFGLTDETYALLTTTPEPNENKINYYTLITLFNHVYWTLGCLFGGLLGSLLNLHIKGLEFIMPALFIVLTLEQYFKNRSALLIVSATTIGILTIVFLKSYMLLSAMIIASLVLVVHGKQKAWELT